MPERDSPPTGTPRYPTGTKRALIIASATLSAMLVSVDSTIANVALPHMQASLSTSQDQVIWVLTSYMIATAIATPLSGWLASRYGRKKTMVLAVVGFTLASLMCGMAINLPMMVGARILQGLCGAALIPLNQSLLVDISPPEELGRAMAITGIGIMFGPLIAPTLGGFLIDTLNWRWVFLINLPLGVLAALGLALFTTEALDSNPSRFDLFGFATLSLFLASFQLMIDRGPQLGWFGSDEIWIEATSMAFFAWATLVQTMTAANSFIRPRLFTDRNYTMGCLLGAATGFGVIAAVPTVTIMIQNLLGYSARQTGLISSPRGLGTLISMFIIGRLIGRIDARLILMTGLALAAFGLHMMSALSLTTDAGPIVWAGLIQGLGSGLIMVPMSSLVFSTLRSEYRNEGASIYALSRNLGTSLGVSLLQILTVNTSARVQSRLVEQVRPDNPVLALRMPDLDLTAPRSVATMMGQISRQAQMVAYTDIYWLLCLIIIAMMPLVLLFKPTHRASWRMRKVA